jgi:DNA repair exonuclease SbcCD ATPase subunit
MIAEWQEQHKQLIENLDNSKKRIEELEAQIEKMKCCGNCRFSESDKLNGTFCHREGCFVVASGKKCKLWEN